MIKNLSGYKESDEVMKNGILVGCHHGLTSEMKIHMKKSIKKFIEKYSKS